MLRVVRGDDRRSWGILAGRFRRPIDPGGCWERFGPWWPLDEPLGMGGVRGQTGAVPDGEDRGGAAVVDVGRREIAEAAVMVRVVVPREQIAADAARVFERAERGSGNSGRYFRVRNCDSENGLSLLTRGRE